MSIEVFNEAGSTACNETMLIDVASFVLGEMDIHRDAELSIFIVDEDTIADLHLRWLDLPGPTDVMSFPIDELTPGSGGRPDQTPAGESMLGDIVLCPDFAAKQAEAAGHSLDHELALLTVHGCLHLMGYDHATAEDEREMFALQNELLADWYYQAAREGKDVPQKPTTKGAFPTAADRENLDRTMGQG